MILYELCGIMRSDTILHEDYNTSAPTLTLSLAPTLTLALAPTLTLTLAPTLTLGLTLAVVGSN